MRDLSAANKAAAIAAIKGASLRNIGLMPQQTGTSKMLVAVPISPEQAPAAALDTALWRAIPFWPNCSEWRIGCADTASHPTSIPADFVLLHNTEICGEFSF